jgi:hypothetical protein
MAEDRLRQLPGNMVPETTYYFHHQSRHICCFASPTDIKSVLQFDAFPIEKIFASHDHARWARIFSARDCWNHSTKPMWEYISNSDGFDRNRGEIPRRVFPEELARQETGISVWWLAWFYSGETNITEFVDSNIYQLAPLCISTSR